MSSEIRAETITTNIPARMDRLPWARWHWLVVLALGTVWILDGLEVTIKGAVGASLKDSIGFSTVQVAGSASIYLFGAISGALFWGYLTDRYGRRKLFIITLLTYMVGVCGTTLAGLFDVSFLSAYVWFAIFRFITGFGIGGEYSAINSAIDELIPARVRGWVDLAINGSYWIGTLVGASLGFVFLNTLPTGVAWRAAFGLGGFLAIGLLLLRLYVPESPRWLMVHGREEEAEETVREIEEDVAASTDEELEEPDEDDAMELRERESVGFVTIGRTLFSVYPRRSVAGGSIMLTQAFLYNAIFFTYGLMLTTYFGVSSSNVPLFLIPFAIGNFAGPLLLGRLFDTVGRRTMIPLTFGLAGVLTILAGFMFWQEWFGNSAIWMTVAWVIIFFFASAGASAGYLTISETFPLEIRAMAIAFFYALATGIGGVGGPYLYGRLIATDQRIDVFWGYLVGGGLMILGAVMHRIYGIEAARKGLESVAAPLSQEEAEEQTGEDRGDESGEGGDGERAEGDGPRRRRRREPAIPSPARRPTAGGFGFRSYAEVPDHDRWIEPEIDALATALVEQGPADRGELRRRVRATRWGPRRFAQALRRAEEGGIIRRKDGRFVASRETREGAEGHPA